MDHKINGETLLGFGDFFSGYDSVGAADRGYGSEIGAKKKPSPSGKGPGGPAKVRTYPKGTRSRAIEHHGKVLHKSRGIATHAAKLLGHAQMLLAKKPAPVKPAPGKLPASALSGRTVHVGAATLTPKANLAVQKHNAAVAKSNQAAKLLAQHAIKTKGTLAKLAKKMVVQKKLVKRLRTPSSRRTHVGDLLADPVIGAAVGEVFQEYYTAIGAAPDPANPGFLDDGSPDPAATGFSDADLGPLTEDPLDSGAELGPAPSMDTYFEDMTLVGGIAYDGSKGTPDGYVLSYGLATRKTDNPIEPDSVAIDGTQHYGYVFGAYDKKVGGIPWGEDMTRGAWNHLHGRHWFSTGGWSTPVDASEAFTSNTKSSPYGIQYGPLVGNPTMKDFASMRVDGKGNMFWLPQEAPDWLTFPIKQAAALTAQAAKKAEEEAAKAAAAAEAKARADEAAAKAAQDAANALAESQAASEAKQTTSKAEGEQATAETAAQQAIVQQQQAETSEKTLETEQAKEAGTLMIEQARQQAEQDKQTAALLMQQAQQELDYAKAHPEEAYAVDQEEPPMPGMEEGGAEGTYDDDAPIPGGDVMADSDGEGFQE